MKTALLGQKELEENIQTNAEILLGSRLVRDDECCLVCGLTDYEDGNEIGFCDKCGLSVHLKCYGLPKGWFSGEFVCDQCQTFGSDAGM